MTRDDIIRMAREAGAERNSDFPDWSLEDDQLERFAALVAAAEREACAKICDDEWYIDARTYKSHFAHEDAAAAIRSRGKA